MATATKIPATGPAGPLIRDFPRIERPRERLRMRGARQLTNAELIAILLRTGVRGENVLAMATRILSSFDGLRGLSRLTYDDLCGEHGVSDAKACQLLAGIELGRRVATLGDDDRAAVGSPADIARLVLPDMASLEREHMRVVLLDTKNHVVAIEELYTGSVNAAIVRSAEVFAAAVRRTCPAVIVVHNHPSGDPTPSPEDIQITRQLVEAGRILEVELVDHLVIGQGSYVSMREQRLGFENIGS